MKRILLPFLAILSLALFSCQKAPFVTINTPRSFTFTRDGGTQNITFTCNRDWSVSSSESWIQVSPSSGTAKDGEITVKITCTENTTYDTRTAIVTVKVEELTETISISQDTGLGLLVSPTTFDLTNAAQTIEIEVQKNVEYSFSIDPAAREWITHTGTKGLTSEKLSFRIAANETYDDREGVIAFKQSGGPLFGMVVVKQSQTNGLFITTPEYDLSNEAHTLTVDVQANIDYEVSSDVDWIANTKATTKGLVNSQITLQVNANENYDDREGHVTVKQKNGDLTGVITIRQDENYGILVSDENVEITSDAQSVEVEVKYNVDFDVIIPAEAQGTMITSVEYDDGTGNTKALSTRKYRFGISENTDYDAREVSVTFKQKDGSLSGTVLIKQAQKDVIIIGKKEYGVGKDGETIEIQLQTNVEFDVIIPDEAKEWVTRVESTPTKALENESVFLKIAENPTYYDRKASVVIKKKDADLKESVIIKQKQTDVIIITDETNSVTMPYSGGEMSFGVMCNVDIEVELSDTWVHHIETKSLNTSSLSFLIDENTNRFARNGVISIKQKGGSLKAEYTIRQVPYGAIDLGLSVYWDVSNLGSSTPEGYGDYYAWGETERKEEYSWSTYKWCNGSFNQLTKYNISEEYGTVDSKTEFSDYEYEDDVARVLLGKDWRIPSENEWTELYEKCSWNWTTINEVKGYLVKSKSNNNSIFLPLAGYRYGSSISEQGGIGEYWSSTVLTPYSTNAILLIINSDIISVNHTWRYYGASIRAVCK